MRRRPERVLGDRLLPHMKRWTPAGRLSVYAAMSRERALAALVQLEADGKAETRQVKRGRGIRTELGPVLWRRAEVVR